jgi:pimeloyl-ACP methyl ester carboxylesterase
MAAVEFIETSDGVRLHVDVDGEGDPITVLAHGLTNNCRELAAFTPLVPGTKLRFCFRGHGHSDAPEAGYRFEDFARDVDAVASAYGATRAVGTSLGAGAIANMLTREPDRFERLVFLLPAGLDRPFERKDRFLQTAGLLEGRSPEEAIAEILADPERAKRYLQAPWLRDFDLSMWEHEHPEGVARAIREVIEDYPVSDRELLRQVETPTLIVCLRDDPVHPAELGEILHELMPGSELLSFADETELVREIPSLVARVSAFLL